MRMKIPNYFIVIVQILKKYLKFFSVKEVFKQSIHYRCRKSFQKKRCNRSKMPGLEYDNLISVNPGPTVLVVACPDAFVSQDKKEVP